MTRRNKGPEAPLDQIVDWSGLGRVTVKQVCEHLAGGAYNASFIRRAIAEIGATDIACLARWEGEAKRRIRESGMRGRRHPNSEMHIGPKRPMPWPRD